MTAAFLHFFFLSSFCWVLTEAWQSYLAVIGRIRTRLVRKRFLCLGWGKSPAGLVPGWAGGEAPRAPPWYPLGLSEGETEAQWRKADLGVLVPSTWHPLTSQTVGSCQKGPIPVPIHGGQHRGDAGGGGDATATPPPCSSSLVSPFQACQPSWSQFLSASRGPKATGRRASTWGWGRGTGRDTGLGTGTAGGWQQCWGQGTSPLRQPLTRHGPLQLLALAGGRFALRLRGTRCCHRAGELTPSFGP